MPRTVKELGEELKNLTPAEKIKVCRIAGILPVSFPKRRPNGTKFIQQEVLVPQAGPFYPIMTEVARLIHSHQEALELMKKGRLRVTADQLLKLSPEGYFRAKRNTELTFEELPIGEQVVSLLRTCRIDLQNLSPFYKKKKRQHTASTPKPTLTEKNAAPTSEAVDTTE